MERGETAPSFKTLSRIAAALGVEVRDFFGIDDFAAREGRDDPLAAILILVSSATPEMQRRALKMIEGLLNDQ